MPEPAHVVVVGGGIAGLAAAARLRRDGPAGLRITLVDGARRLGGKLATSEVAGVPVDEGAEAFLVRRPEAVAFARARGLGDELVHPAARGAGVWSRGRLRPLPKRTMLGVPGDLRELAASGVLSTPGLLRVGAEAAVPQFRLDGDASVGHYLATRLGRELVDRLVDPLLGGVYAGRADRLSLDATAPGLAVAARRGRSLVRAVGSALPQPSDAPVFATVPGGLDRLVGAAARRSGAEIVLGEPVRELRRASGEPPGGAVGGDARSGDWRLTIGSTRDARTLDADAVVLAVPAAPASRLLSGVAPAASAELASIGYASVAIVTLALPRTGFPGGDPPAGSGWLVPAVERRTVKAVTVASAKWAHLGAAARDLVLVRASIGRYGEPEDLQRDDDDLVAAAVADLARMSGLAGRPVDARVSRWGGALPQYAVGHLDRVARIRASIDAQPGLAVCGAAYDGVGIPACIGTGEQAAERALSGLVRG